MVMQSSGMPFSKSSFGNARGGRSDVVRWFMNSTAACVAGRISSRKPATTGVSASKLLEEPDHDGKGDNLHPGEIEAVRVSEHQIGKSRS